MLENKATLNDLEHCSGLHGISVLLSTRLGEVCSSDRIEKLCVHYVKLVAIIRLVLIERHGDRNIQMHRVLLMIPYHILLYAFTMHDQLKCTSVHETLNLANVVGPDEYHRFTRHGYFATLNSRRPLKLMMTPMNE